MTQINYVSAAQGGSLSMGGGGGSEAAEFEVWLVFRD